MTFHEGFFEKIRFMAVLYNIVKRLSCNEAEKSQPFHMAAPPHAETIWSRYISTMSMFV